MGPRLLAPAEANGPRGRAFLRGVLATGLLTSLTLLSACSKESAKPVAETPSVAVRAVRVAAQPLEETLDITGSLVSTAAVEVKTQFAGRVSRMLKQEGDRVRKGELLALLDETDARLALGQARATFAVAQATLARAQVAEQHAVTEKQRAEKLLRSGGITDRDYQAAQLAAQDTRAQVKLVEAQIEQARQAVAQAEKHLGDCRMVSPIDGEIERKFLNPGGWVDGSALLYKLVNNQRLELETSVASSELARLAKGQKIRFVVAAYPQEEFTASILTISPGIQVQNRSAAVRALVPNPTGKLKAGMFVKGRIITGVKPGALLVPAEAVWHRAGQPPFIFVVASSRAQRREVKTGLEQAQGIEITEGLKAGEQVVAEQNLEVADGRNITPRP